MHSELANWDGSLDSPQPETPSGSTSTSLPLPGPSTTTSAPASSRVDTGASRKMHSRGAPAAPSSAGSSPLTFSLTAFSAPPPTFGPPADKSKSKSGGSGLSGIVESAVRVEGLPAADRKDLVAKDTSLETVSAENQRRRGERAAAPGADLSPRGPVQLATRQLTPTAHPSSGGFVDGADKVQVCAQVFSARGACGRVLTSLSREAYRISGSGADFGRGSCVYTDRGRRGSRVLRCCHAVAARRGRPGHEPHSGRATGACGGGTSRFGWDTDVRFSHTSPSPAP